MPTSISLTDLSAIERQLEKLRGTIDNLSMLANRANGAGNGVQADRLLAKIPDLQEQQFLLYMEKEQIIVTSKEWLRLRERLQGVNEQIAEDLNGLDDIARTLAATSRLIKAAAAVVALL